MTIGGVGTNGMVSWLPGAVVACGVLALLAFERRRPLRRAVEPGARRIARNVAIGALTAAEVAWIERPIVERVVAATNARRRGLLWRIGLPRWMHVLAAVVLLDYTLYVWHILLHRFPSLWRLHLPHHIDRDLDTSTALRFHCAEFAASVPWRLAQVAMIGVTPAALAWWRTLTLAEVLFHHSNLRLPARFERRLAWLIVTPRLHGIHHSQVRAERDANFSSGLTLWDRLHGTFRDNVPQDRIAIGIPGYGAGEVTLGKALAAPLVGPKHAAVPPPGRCAPPRHERKPEGRRGASLPAGNEPEAPHVKKCG